jgi:hypothetical protein
MIIIGSSQSLAKGLNIVIIKYQREALFDVLKYLTNKLTQILISQKSQ